MMLAKARIVNYDHNCSFIVLATVITNVNYDRHLFIVQATGQLNLCQVFNSRSNCIHATHLLCIVAKLPSLKLIACRLCPLNWAQQSSTTTKNIKLGCGHFLRTNAVAYFWAHKKNFVAIVQELVKFFHKSAIPTEKYQKQNESSSETFGRTTFHRIFSISCNSYICGYSWSILITRIIDI
jgi:hypothetical protein